jgi:lipid-A-disaccharide synthase
LRAADAALCKSGTTTLEAAVAGCPLAVAYKTSPWTYAIARRVVKIPRIGLVNVVAGREVAQEFVQDAVVPERIAETLKPLLTPGDPGRASMLDSSQVRRPGNAQLPARGSDRSELAA